MQPNAPFGQLHWKRRRVRPLFDAVLNCLVRNEPGTAAAARITATRMAPARDVAFVLIRNTESKPINFDSSRFREVKNVFMRIVQEPLRIDRLEMTMRLKIAFLISNGDRFDPMNCVLQDKQVTQLDCNFVWQHRIRWGGPDVEKK